MEKYESLAMEKEISIVYFKKGFIIHLVVGDTFGGGGGGSGGGSCLPRRQHRML
jgi:hypothetical protein